MNVPNAVLNSVNHWQDLCETDGLEQLCVIGVQVMTELMPVDNFHQIFCVGN